MLRVLYPVRDNDIEINWIEFLVDPESPIPKPSRQVSRLNEIDFVYITEQVAKCDEKISSADFEGAITNARNLLESICKYILDDGNELNRRTKDGGDIPEEAVEGRSGHGSPSERTGRAQPRSGGD